MIIERTDKEVIFKIPYDTDLDKLREFNDLFRYIDITSKSKARQEDVDNIVSEIKKGRWNRTKKLLSVSKSFQV